MKDPVRLAVGDPVSSRPLQVGDRIIYTGKGIWVPYKVRRIHPDGKVDVSSSTKGWTTLYSIDGWNYMNEV